MHATVHAEDVSVSLGQGASMKFAWVPLVGTNQTAEITIGDLSGNRLKEPAITATIWGPFSRHERFGYYLGKTEVTEAQWAAVTGSGPESNLPVRGKTYAEIQRFLEDFNRIARTQAGYPRTPGGTMGVARLPSEPEWEYAARGAAGPRYKDNDPYGGDIERHEVFSTPGSSGVKDAGSLPPNDLGLHDMLGNVREFVEGSYSLGGMSGGYTLKGGWHLSERTDMRSSSRTEVSRVADDGTPLRPMDAGFRVCISSDVYNRLSDAPPVPAQKAAGARPMAEPDSVLSPDPVVTGLSPPRAEPSTSFLAPRGKAPGSRYSPQSIRVLLLGDSLSVGALGAGLQNSLLARFGPSQVRIYASCGSSPEDWLSNTADVVTHCGYRRYDSRGPLLIREVEGKPSRGVVTPKLSAILARCAPDIIIVELGCHWLARLGNGELDAETCRTIIGRFTSEIRNKSTVRQPRILWLAPPAVPNDPRANIALAAVLRLASLEVGFTIVDSRTILTPYGWDTTEGQELVLSDSAAQRMTQDVMAALPPAVKTPAPETSLDLRDAVGLRPGSDMGIASLTLSDSNHGETKDLQVVVKPRPGTPIDLRPGAVRIDVIFYEEVDGEIEPSHRNVEAVWPTAPVDWKEGAVETLQVTYSAPMSEDGRRPARFYGYMVNVYYRGQLQETRADPVRLEEMFPPALSEGEAPEPVAPEAIQ